MKKFVTFFVLIASVLFPFYTALHEIIVDSIPFWYDPARDMLLSWNNLNKFTLVGPPSGIPGIFYGPHWLWFLSLGLIFSKDPRVVAALVLTIPYFTVFPFLLFRFAKVFGRKIAVLLWLFFILGYKAYTTFIWSPHLAPLFLLIVIYFLVFTDLNGKSFRNYLRIFFAGIFAGLLINVHISFGLVIIFSCFIFIAAELLLFTPRKKWRASLGDRVIIMSSFALGLFASLSPNLIFELRHGFMQTKAVIDTVNKSLHGSAVVGYLGLTRVGIIMEFLKVGGKLFSIPQKLLPFLYSLVFLHIVYNFKSYIAGFNKPAKRLLVFLTVAILCLFAVFLSAKNPVWTYHFIGSEVIVMLSFGLLLTRYSLLRNLLTAWVIYLLVLNIYSLISPAQVSRYKVSDLGTKKHIADVIYNDSRKQPFGIFAYSTSIYTYDYDYIFRWFGTYKYPGGLPQDPSQVKIIYLIIPDVASPIKADFINYRTPPNEYKTSGEWKIEDGTTIIKREK